MSKPNSQLSILHIADFGSLYGGNFISSISCLASQLSALGFRFILVLNEKAKEREWVDSFSTSSYSKVYFIDNKSGLIGKTRQIMKIAEIENSVLIHTHFTSFDIAAWMARVFGKSRYALVWHVHSAFPVSSTLRRKMKDFIKFKISGRSALSFHVSEATLELEARRGLIINNAVVVPNAVDFSRFEPVRKEFSSQRDGSTTHLSKFLMFGWDPHTKGVDIAVQAFEKLFQDRQDFKLLLVGEERLQTFVNDYFHGLLPQWLCLLSPVADVTTLYREAHFFLSASRYEGSSYSVAEALSCGIPVISSDIRGIQWAKKAPVLELFTSESSESLDALLRKLLQNDYLQYRNRCYANCSFMEENYSLEEWGKQISRLYDTLIHS